MWCHEYRRQQCWHRWLEGLIWALWICLWVSETSEDQHLWKLEVSCFLLQRSRRRPRWLGSPFLDQVKRGTPNNQFNESLIQVADSTPLCLPLACENDRVCNPYQSLDRRPVAALSWIWMRGFLLQTLVVHDTLLLSRTPLTFSCAAWLRSGFTRSWSIQYFKRRELLFITKTNLALNFVVAVMSVSTPCFFLAQVPCTTKWNLIAWVFSHRVDCHSRTSSWNSTRSRYLMSHAGSRTWFAEDGFAFFHPKVPWITRTSMMTKISSGIYLKEMGEFENTLNASRVQIFEHL